MPGLNLSNIENNFQLLLKRLKVLHVEKQKLEQKILECHEEIAHQKTRLAEQDEKIKMLKMTGSSGEPSENDSALRKEMRNTLNIYIQEIDNCIALLNK